MSCGCSSPSNTPPGSTTPSSAVPPNSYGGQTTLAASGSCANNSCPAPPTSEAEDQDTYCETWVEAIRTKYFGKLLLKFGASCLHTLKSKCSGWIYYDATSENVSVDAQPPFVSSAPQTTKWGFLAKVLTRQKTLCVDGVDVCTQEGRQELAAQMVEEVQCGELAVLLRPKCGTVPLNESADLDKQVGVHVLKPADRTTCDSAQFLVRVENVSDPSCPKYQVMRGIKLPQSDIGVASTQELTSAKPPIWVRSGGTDENPCWILKVNNRSANNELPANASACQIAVFSGEQWEASDLGHTYLGLKQSAPQSISAPYGDITKTTNMAAVADWDLENVPQPRCADAKVWAEIEVWLDVSEGPSGSFTSGRSDINGVQYIGASSAAVSGITGNSRIIRIDITASSTLSYRIYRNSGSGSIRGSLNLLGYLA